MEYDKKYLKYKNKYLNLKNIYGGSNFVIDDHKFRVNYTRYERMLKRLYKKFIDDTNPSNYSVDILNNILLKIIPNNENENRTYDNAVLIRFGANIKTIDDELFNNRKLININIPNIITTIGKNSFAYNKLTNINIPDSVININFGAFYNNNLSRLIISNNVKIIDAYAFAENKLINLIIPNSVTYIGYHAFYNNPLQNVTIPIKFKDEIKTIFGENENVKYTFTEDLKSNIIKKFFKKNKDKIRLNFLNFVCNDASLCLTFGKESKIISEFFNGFTSFDYVVTPSRRIGSVSVNGFIYLIDYQRDNYNVSTILKSSQNPTADNLVYEYEVGQYINKMSQLYSCFVETYGLFKYNNRADYNTLLTQPNINDTSIFKKALRLINDYNDDYTDICKNSKYYCILTQNIRNSISLNQLFEDDAKAQGIIDDELIYILYQIYFPLAMMKNDFTHYDLHLHNILLYQLESNSCIQYNYTLPNGTLISFKSKYVVKIIDYGRSYFNNSQKIYDHVCANSNCPRCGYFNGFAYLKTINDIKEDLRPLRIIYAHIIHKLNIQFSDSDYESLFMHSYLSVLNTDSIYIILNDLIKKNNSSNDRYNRRSKIIGELNIYSDGRPLLFKKN